MASLTMLKMVAVVVGMMVLLGRESDGAIDCKQVTSQLSPCIQYLQGKAGPSPPPACCDGVRSLAGAAGTTADRRAACNCMKSAAAEVPNLNDANVGNLPGQCNVNLPFRASVTTNCDQIP